MIWLTEGHTTQRLSLKNGSRSDSRAGATEKGRPGRERTTQACDVRTYIYELPKTGSDAAQIQRVIKPRVTQSRNTWRNQNAFSEEKKICRKRTSSWVANTAQTAGRSVPTNSSLIVQRLVGMGIWLCVTDKWNCVPPRHHIRTHEPNPNGGETRLSPVPVKEINYVAVHGCEFSLLNQKKRTTDPNDARACGQKSLYKSTRLRRDWPMVSNLGWWLRPGSERTSSSFIIGMVQKRRRGAGE